jgi:hypothetical protein
VGFANGQARPLTAMLLQAQLLKQLTPLYVIAMAGVDQAGLLETAFLPTYDYYRRHACDARIPSFGMFYSCEDPCRHHQISAMHACYLANRLQVSFRVPVAEQR